MTVYRFIGWGPMCLWVRWICILLFKIYILESNRQHIYLITSFFLLYLAFVGTWLWVSQKAPSFILCLGHSEICYFPLKSTHEGIDPRAERPRFSLFIIFHFFWLKCHLTPLCLRKLSLIQFIFMYLQIFFSFCLFCLFLIINVFPNKCL